MSRRSAIVIGAGIVGLAVAHALVIRGYAVKVIERNEKAVGASIRNFGMVWPIGQPDGGLYEIAILSRQIWKEVCDEAGIWYDEAGSLHLAYTVDEWRVLEELQEIYRHRGYQLLNAGDTRQRSSVVAEKDLKGALYSTEELIVDPRKTMERIPSWLAEKYGVRFIWGKAITDICYPAAYSGKEVFEADEIYVCSGADFETLYPELFSSLPITKCKLQMMRMAEQPGQLRIGPALCGGLSLAHYNSFRAASSLPILKQRFEQEYPDHLRWGIHVMVSQNETGELTIGDSHEYGLTHDPFDRHFINQLILGYLKKFAVLPGGQITSTWNGIYSKLTNGESHVILEPEKEVTIINGLGGAGMTLSFGLCEQMIAGKTKSKEITTVSVQ